MMTVPLRSPIRILVLAASLCAGSLNARLAALAAESMGQFDVPGYDGDVETTEGIPPGAGRFRDRLELADGFIIASPEYNASMPGVLQEPHRLDVTSPAPALQRTARAPALGLAIDGGGKRGL
jgi:chromate reductase, NAD(P)H dehydrogenase (quinone)